MRAVPRADYVRLWGEPRVRAGSASADRRKVRGPGGNSATYALLNVRR